MAKRIYRGRSDKVIAGVCGGLGEYFGIDRVLIRIVWVVTVICAGTGILAYILAWILIPREPEVRPATNT